MPTLLHKVKSMRWLSFEVHPTSLLIYDEYMVYIRRGIIWRNEATISYNHVSQVYLRKGYLSSSIEVINTGGVENIIVPYINKSEAAKAKKIIDQKVFHTHARVTGKDLESGRVAPDLERKLARLKELVNKGMISSREFERKHKEMLKSLR